LKELPESCHALFFGAGYSAIRAREDAANARGLFEIVRPLHRDLQLSCFTAGLEKSK
jgi:hypothetical protein